MSRQTDGQTLVSQPARQTDGQLGFVAYKIPLFGPERVRGEGEVSGLSLAFVLLLHTNNLNGREEGGGGEGRREGGSTISEFSVYPKATATLKVAKLCRFHFITSQACVTMAKVYGVVVPPQLKRYALILVNTILKATDNTSSHCACWPFHLSHWASVLQSPQSWPGGRPPPVFQPAVDG